MNKKIVSFIIAFILPLTFLVGCKDSSKKESNFVMTEDTKALDGSVEYNAKTYKEAFYSTKNYSKEYLQNEFETFVSEITEKEDLNELIDLLNSYSHTQDGDFTVLKSIYEKYNKQNKNSKNITLNSNALSEISSRLYKATLNATKKVYNINDFYIYYKDQLLNSTSAKNNDEFENEAKIEAIKEYTIADIYKNAYDQSFISKVILSVKNKSTSEDEKTPLVEDKVENKVETSKEDTNNSDKKEDKTEKVENKPTNDQKEDKTEKVENEPTNDQKEDKTEKVENKPTNNQKEDKNTSDDKDDNNNTKDDVNNNPEQLTLTETLKSQIAEAGRNVAKDYIAQNIADPSDKYCREVYDELENDNPLGKNKEEGFNIFEKAFKEILAQNNIEQQNEEE